MVKLSGRPSLIIRTNCTFKMVRGSMVGLMKPMVDGSSWGVTSSLQIDDPIRLREGCLTRGQNYCIDGYHPKRRFPVPPALATGRQSSSLDRGGHNRFVLCARQVRCDQ